MEIFPEKRSFKNLVHEIFSGPPKLCAKSPVMGGSNNSCSGIIIAVFVIVISRHDAKNNSIALLVVVVITSSSDNNCSTCNNEVGKIAVAVAIIGVLFLSCL